ncbi:prepilin-type N-terminal cleavage/methylation domain-containing protein [Acidovorax sp. CF316]|uniref:type II secretion system protein n=1 Tax=Acidovorax sp. CF316 TaxID=1144317 RepID=UPI00026BCA5B|nr:type II secretion system protein [Acidovorax sp. CF316]EJE54484.1 prepilin-type N-terminal cleavage/methylation domain-containing protein [Acidovorax sp. CF316]
MTARMQRPGRLRQAGFSLVELAVSLAIVGLLGVIAWRWVASTREPLQRPAIMGQLAEAQAAVEGFVLARGRLPCAAATTGGAEACGNAAAVLLPWRDLGLSSRFSQLRYGVNQAGAYNLAVAPANTVSPTLGFDYTQGILAVPQNTEMDAALGRLRGTSGAIPAAVLQNGATNGLDWCRVLRRYAADAAPPAGVLRATNPVDATSITLAFIIAHPGMNGVFEGNNTGVTFDFPGRAQTNTFDDLAVGVGPSDLSARIGCVARLSAMQAAAQGAYTAYDNARVVQRYWALRVFDIAQAKAAKESAETGVILAAMNVALAAGSAALAVASAANTEALTIAGVALSIANAASAAVEVGLAATDLTEAIQAEQDSIAKELASRAYLAHVYDTFTQALNSATLLDAKGLNP